MRCTIQRLVTQPCGPCTSMATPTKRSFVGPSIYADGMQELRSALLPPAALPPLPLLCCAAVTAFKTGYRIVPGYLDDMQGKVAEICDASLDTVIDEQPSLVRPTCGTNGAASLPCCSPRVIECGAFKLHAPFHQCTTTPPWLLR